MITTIQQVYNDFYSEIRSRNYMLGTEKVPVKYYDEFNNKPTSVTRAHYPVISIQNYRPKPSREWVDSTQIIYDGLGGFVDDIPSTIQAYREPILFDFRFDVSIATKSHKDLDKLCDIFLKEFGYESEMMLDKTILTDGTVVGVPVWVRNEPQDIPRTDEVKEVNYEFTFNCFVDYRDPEVLDIIKTINITLTQNGKN